MFYQNNQMTTRQKNKVIAEFDNYDIVEGLDLNDQLHYHESYDWLMPVWVKFRDLYPKDRGTHSYHCHKICGIILNSGTSEAFEELYKAIEWYNSQTKNKRD